MMLNTKYTNHLSVAFGIDRNYYNYFGVALYSLLKHNTDSIITIYLISNHDIQNNFKHKINKILFGHSNATVVYLKVDDKLLKQLYVSDHISSATYYRLLLPELLPVEKILYLDTDILIVDNISNLYNTNIENFYVGAVLDHGMNTSEYNETNEKILKKINLYRASDYFNAGVLLMNLTKIKQDDIHKKVIDFILHNPDKITLWDQCGLNAILKGNWKRIQNKYNLQRQEIMLDKKNLLDISIIHYIGYKKPWHFKNNHPYKKLFWQYVLETPFKKDIYYAYFIDTLKSITYRPFIQPIQWILKHIK